MENHLEQDEVTEPYWDHSQVITARMDIIEVNDSRLDLVEVPDTILKPCKMSKRLLFTIDVFKSHQAQAKVHLSSVQLIVIQVSQ